MKKLILLLVGLLPTLAGAQAALPSPVLAPAALPLAATDRRHYWAAVELGRCTLGSLALGADLHGEVPRHRLLTAGVHDKASTLLFDGHSGQQYELLTYQVLAGKLVKGHACPFIAPAGLALLRTHSYVEKGVALFTPLTDDRRQTTVGVPVQVQGYLVALQKLGLGFTATLNLNSVQTTASLGLAVGHLPTRLPPPPLRATRPSGPR